MATSPAAESWREALKVHKHLRKQIDKSQASAAGRYELSQFEKLDGILETLRLSCVRTIFIDFEYATANKTEHVLWDDHTTINNEYRRALSELKKSNNVVEQRKTEKMYHNFLRVAQRFYTTYIQRLAGRYDIQELKRLAGKIPIGEENSPDQISPVPDQLYNFVLRSCHATLIRLGDLTRYRVLAKQKKTGGFESALTFYSLAHDLLPISGYGHHQMGIINLEENNHFDAVYHFYRAWVANEPHPNGEANLGAKLHELVKSNPPPPRQVSAIPRAAFARWFLQLHAHFFRGQPFPQHAELEGEVIHRLEMLARNPDVGDVLLKAVLINMAAFQVSLTGHKALKKGSASSFSQFVLILNAKFITVICQALLTELGRRPRLQNDDGQASENREMTPICNHLLPLLRLYMIWLASQRMHIFGNVTGARTPVGTMIKMLCKVITLLCEEATCHEDLASSPYLLSEDLEIRGLTPLDKTHVPEACRSFCNNAGEMKPHPEADGAALGTYTESLARMLDILRAAYFLAEDEDVPLNYEVTGSGLIFGCQWAPTADVQQFQDRNRQSSSNGESQAPSGIMAPPPVIAVPQATPRVVREPVAQRSQVESLSSSTANGMHDEGSVYDHAENTVMSMLSPFLKPPTPVTGQNPSSTTESSYGMHSATAEDIFAAYSPQANGDLSPSAVAPSKTFEQLPWNYFHTPNPRTDATAGMQEAFPRPGMPQSPVTGMARGSGRPDDPFHHSPANGQSPDNGTSHTDREHRSNLLQSFNGNMHRTSSFSHWSPDYQGSRGAQQQSAISPRFPAALNGIPASSNMSTFSHPSSLYHGTPVQGNGLTHQFTRGGPTTASDDNALWRHDTSGNDGNVQATNTASNYDAAIFNAAMHGKG